MINLTVTSIDGNILNTKIFTKLSEHIDNFPKLWSLLYGDTK